MDYLEPDTMRIYRSGFVLLPVVTKLDRYGDLGRDKSFPFTQRARLRPPLPPQYRSRYAEFQRSIKSPLSLRRLSQVSSS